MGIKTDRHAYLILAHHEFGILERLLAALDDERNSIYIHIDSKVVSWPELKVHSGVLHVLENRIDVRWGDLSVVEAELLLFRTAINEGPYAYYHLISGVDMPLLNQSQIHAFFRKHSGKEFIGYSCGDQSLQLSRKVQRYHLFPGSFRKDAGIAYELKRIIRAVVLRFQLLVGLRRNDHIEFKKGTQWVSVTEDFVSYLLDKEKVIKAMYKMTFCADEVVLQTICWHSRFRGQLYDVDNEGVGSQRFIRWKDNILHDWGNEDIEELLNSGYMFARKFNSIQMEVVDQILKHILSSEANEKTNAE
ncbi:beta-1,6-N-acetylglucosaminyltransferase [Sphingobacterium suaedae]|uniref:Peptide O-xylosyltransferase n=1 Tax=Sphingobacterium suaedae TaxID=1686402 RepID=A0ABW5KMM0_9SPHI